MTSIPSESETLKKRTYQDLLDLEMSCPVVASLNGSAASDSKQSAGKDAGHASSSGQGDFDAELFEDRKIMDAIGLSVLGTLKGGEIKVFSRCHRRTTIIPNISKLSYEGLLNICGPTARARVQKANVDNIPGIYTLTEVKQSIAIIAGFVLISDRTELGIGIWQGQSTNGEKHDSCVLVSTGEAAEINGDGKLKKITEPHCRGHLLNFDGESEPWFEFEKLSGLIDQCDDKFARDTMDMLISLFQRWKWTHQVATPIVLAGLVFSSWVQAFWDWRPQVAIVGPSNAGKSTLFNCISAIFGKLCLKSSKSTAAGLRQNIGTSSKIVLCDEFEQSAHRSETLEMIRAAGRGDTVMRGTTSQKAQSFALHHIFWVAAIEVGLNRAADRNRFVVLELMSPEKEKRGKLVLPSDQDLQELGYRVLAVSLKYIHKAKIYANKIKDARIEGVDARIIESYAVPAAMMSVIQGYDEEACREILSQMLGGMRQEEIGDVKDEANLLESIFSATIFIGRDTHTVASLINTVTYQKNNFEIAIEGLEKYGLSVTTFGEADAVPAAMEQAPCLAIASNAVRTKLLKGTPWENQSIDQILKRVEGAIPLRKFIGKQRLRSVCIPMDYLYQEMLAREGVIDNF